MSTFVAALSFDLPWVTKPSAHRKCCGIRPAVRRRARPRGAKHFNTNTSWECPTTETPSPTDNRLNGNVLSHVNRGAPQVLQVRRRAGESRISLVQSSSNTNTSTAVVGSRDSQAGISADQSLCRFGPNTLQGFTHLAAISYSHQTGGSTSSGTRRRPEPFITIEIEWQALLRGQHQRRTRCHLLRVRPAFALHGCLRSLGWIRP